MKQPIFIILLLLITMGVCGQTYNPYMEQYNPKKKEWKYKEAVKTIALFSTSIILDAVGDGFNDSGRKGMGHFLQASSTGLLVASPFILNVKKYNWGWYAASYISLRIAFFDPTYNLSRGLPIGYIGNSSMWDKTLRGFKTTPSSLLLGRSLFLIVGFTIPLNEF